MEYLKRYLSRIFKFEKDYQKLKKDLTRLPDFNVEKLFGAVDRLKEGKVAKFDFLGFMKRQGLPVNELEVEAFWKRFWPDLDEGIDCAKFGKMLTVLDLSV